MRPRVPYWSCFVVFGFGAVFCLATAMRAGGRVSLGALVLSAWAISPQVLGMVLAWLFRRSAPALWVLFVGGAVIAGGGSFVLYESFGPHIDPQSPIVLILLPGWEFLVLLPFAAVSGWLAWRKRRVEA